MSLLIANPTKPGRLSWRACFDAFDAFDAAFKVAFVHKVKAGMSEPARHDWDQVQLEIFARFRSCDGNWEEVTIQLINGY